MKKYSKLMAILLAVAMLLPGVAQVAEAAIAEDTVFIAVMDLNLRSKNDDIASPVVFVPEGSEVKFTGEETKNGYFSLEYKGVEGYAHRGNVTSVENYNNPDKSIHTIELKEESNGRNYKVVQKISLRTGNSNQYRSIELMERDGIVKHLGTTENGWFLVEYEETKGYVYRGDVTSTGDSGDDKLHDIALEEEANGKTFVAIIDMALRTGNSAQYKSIGFVERGEEVVHLGTTKNGWFKLRNEAGVIGFAYRGNVTSQANYDDLHEEPEVPVEADLTAYNVALAAVEEADYTEASWTAYQAVVAANVVTVENTQAEVDAATAAIVAAQDDLVEVEKMLEVESVSAINAKTLKVTFNKAVPADATLSVKRGTATVNVQETVYNEARTEATLTFPNKLIKGEYEVTVTSGDKTSTGTVEVVDEKVTAIEITSDVAILDATNKDEATVGYKVLNQYGENISDTATLVATAAPLVSGSTVTASNGVINIDNNNTNLTADSKLTVTLLDSSTGTFTSKVVTVSAESKATSFEVKGLYNADNKTPRVGDTAGDYKVLFTAKDQYGNNISQTNFKNGDIIVDSTNKAVVPNVAGGFSNPTISEQTVDGKKYLAITLAGTLGEGTSNINILSKTAGNLVSVPVKVDSAVRVETLTLNTPELAVAGEKIKVPFTAVDQNGKEVTNLTLLNNVNFTVSGAPGATARFERNLATNKNELVLDLTGVTLASGTRNLTIIATTPSLKVVQQSVTMRADAVPTTIGGTQKLVKDFLKGQTATITPATNIVFKDQYGRDIKPTIGSAAGNYQVLVKTSDKAIVEVQAANGAATSDSGISHKIDGTATTGTAAKLEAKAKGTATITLTLLDNAGATIANSSYTYNSTVVEDKNVTTYELGSVPTIADQKEVANNQTEELKVYGIDASGRKVQLNPNAFTFTASNDALAYNPSNGELTVDGNNGTLNYGSGNTVDIPFTVTVVGNDGPVILNGKVTASKAPQVVTDFKVNTTSVINITGVAKESDTVVSVKTNANLDGSGAVITTQAGVKALADAVVAVKDQYGEDFITGQWSDGTLGNVVVSNLPQGKTLAQVVAGDSFKVTAVAKNGKTFAFTVSVVAP